MAELHIERAAAALEPVGDGWTVEGIAVPYSKLSRVTDNGTDYYQEGFLPGAFARDATRGGRWVNLMLGHHGDYGDRYLGRCVHLADEMDGLAAAFRINRDHPQAEAARSGELTGWSVSCRVYRTREEGPPDGRVSWRASCSLDHVAATPVPQYAGAGVVLARDHVVESLASPTPRLDALKEWRASHGHNSPRA